MGTNSEKANKRSPADKAIDAEFIARCLVRGRTQREIVEDINARPGVSYTLGKTMVHQHVKRLELQWKAEAAQTIDEWKRRELRKLDELERELWAAWERSKNEAVTRRVEKHVIGNDEKEKPNIPLTKSSVKQSAQCGDPAYLRLILEVQARRAKMIGLDVIPDVPATDQPTIITSAPINVTVTIEGPTQINEPEAYRDEREQCAGNN